MNLNSASNFLVTCNYIDISLLSTKRFRTVFTMRLYLLHAADFELHTRLCTCCIQN